MNETEQPILKLDNYATHQIRFQTSSGDAIVIIKANGEIWVNPEYTTTEAAQVFWDTVIQINPLIGKK